MGNLKDFINYLELQRRYGAIYVWGGQGQKASESFIKKCESGKHEKNALKLYKKRLDAGYDPEKIKCFDCSGLGVYWMYNLKKIWKGDKTAHGMMGECTLVSKSELKKGCWVFKRYKTGTKRAYHIGYVVDDDLNVIESQGRAYGVVKRPLSKGGWNAYGIPKAFANEIAGLDGKTDVTTPKFTRNLNKGCCGTDVAELQRLLNAAGDNLVVDGEFGSKTKKAVEEFQKRNWLKVDGIAGEKTIAALKDKTKDDGLIVDRLLKRTDPMMRGEDVKDVQKILSKKGYAIGFVDGVFGDRTRDSVKAFQKDNKLEDDGVVGKQTTVALGGVWRG